MFSSPFELFFLIALVALEALRAPERARNRRDRRSGQITRSHVAGLEAFLLTLSFAGLYVLPLIDVFSRWLDFAEFGLAPIAAQALGWIGALCAAGALLVIWRAHRDLGESWSPSLEISAGQQLVTRGIYRLVRHPIYAGMWLFMFAQALLLQNWIAGLAGMVIYAAIYLERVPREERMLVEQFGDAYRAYMARTGGIFPRLRGPR
jgi:protein-S-isoprenylcysteine O-methyltransferase Ste14